MKLPSSLWKHTCGINGMLTVEHGFACSCHWTFLHIGITLLSDVLLDDDYDYEDIMFRLIQIVKSLRSSWIFIQSSAGWYYYWSKTLRYDETTGITIDQKLFVMMRQKINFQCATYTADDDVILHVVVIMFLSTQHTDRTYYNTMMCCSENEKSSLTLHFIQSSCWYLT